MARGKPEKSHKKSKPKPASDTEDSFAKEVFDGLDPNHPHQFIYGLMSHLCSQSEKRTCTYQKVKAIIEERFPGHFDPANVNPTIKELMELGIIANEKKKRASSVIGQLLIARDDYYKEDNLDARMGNMSMDVPAGDFQMEDEEEEGQHQEEERASETKSEEAETGEGRTEESTGEQELSKPEHATDALLSDNFDISDPNAASTRPEKESGELSSEEEMSASPLISKKRKAVLQPRPTPPKPKPVKKSKVDKNRRKSTELIKRAKAKVSSKAGKGEEKTAKKVTIAETKPAAAKKKKLTVKTTAKRATRSRREVV